MSVAGPARSPEREICGISFQLTNDGGLSNECVQHLFESKPSQWAYHESSKDLDFRDQKQANLPLNQAKSNI